MELRHYLSLFKRWAWVLVLGMLLGAAGGYGWSRYQTPLYQASTKVLVMEPTDKQLNNLLGSGNQQLSETFTELLVTRPILEATSERLGYHVSAGKVRVQRVGDSEMIQVTVQHEDPDRAAEVANTLVNVFVEQNEALQASRFIQTEENLEAQRQQVEEQISTLQQELTNAAQENTDAQVQEISKIMIDLEVEIRSLQEEIIRINNSGTPVQEVDRFGIITYVTPTPSVDQRIDISVKSNRVQELSSLLDMYRTIYVQLSLSRNTSGEGAPGSADPIRTALALYQEIYSNLLNNIETIRLARLESTTSVVQVEAALPPSNPIEPRTMVNVLLGAILGLAIFGAGVYVYEYLDDRLRSPEEVSELFELPILGYIGQFGSANKTEPGAAPFVLAQPRSPVTEAFRTLRTNLEFAEIDQHLKSILITSPSVGEGKTTVAVNLATIIAQSGKTVALVDADLRRPKVHKAMSLPNRAGLSDVLRGHASVQEVLQLAGDGKLRVITSGALPPNPVEVLSSEKMGQVLESLIRQFDLVILDGPPFVLADASVLSARADGVLPVVRMGKTEARAGVIMLDQLERVGARVLGIVVNAVQQKEQKYYYQSLKDYNSYSYDLSPNGSATEKVKK